MPNLIINGTTMTETDTNYFNYIKYLTVPEATQKSNADFNSPTKSKVVALEDPVRREIYNKMMSTNQESFTFPDLDTAERHFIMRRAIVDSMTKMTSKPRGINFGYCDPNASPQIPLKEPGDLWSKGPNSAQLQNFRANSGVSSTQAMDQLVQGTSAGECYGAIVACFLIGARAGLGDAAFNNLHPPGTIALNMSTLNMHTYTNNVEKNIHIPGDRMYMKNPDDYYASAKSNGKAAPFWSGENTIFMGTVTQIVNNTPTKIEMFAGLGLPARSETTMRENLRTHYQTDTAQKLSNSGATRLIIFSTVARAKLQ